MRWEGKIFRAFSEGREYLKHLLILSDRDKVLVLETLLQNYDWFYRQHFSQVNWLDHLWAEDKIGILLASLPEPQAREIFTSFAPASFSDRFERMEKPYLRDEVLNQLKEESQ